jgi:hypothetical protein
MEESMLLGHGTAGHSDVLHGDSRRQAVIISNKPEWIVGIHAVFMNSYPVIHAGTLTVHYTVHYLVINR